MFRQFDVEAFSTAFNRHKTLLPVDVRVVQLQKGHSQNTWNVCVNNVKPNVAQKVAKIQIHHATTNDRQPFTISKLNKLWFVILVVNLFPCLECLQTNKVVGCTGVQH